MRSSRRLDAAVIALLFLLPLLWFAPQALGSKTLLPADNLFTFEPWKSFAAERGVGVPQNGLISDLVLENFAWKSFIVEALAAGDPGAVLWNPRLFAGAPFLAAGQHSGLYPLSVLFYVLPLWKAYGVFTWLQLGLAAAGMYVFARVLGQRRASAALAGIAYAFSGFFIVSVNFTMILAAAAWLPLVLAAIETIVRKQQEKGNRPYSPVPYVAMGAVCLGIEILAGHVEITYYTLLVSAFYAAWRLIALWRRLSTAGASPRAALWPPLRLAGWLVIMVVLGLALGAVQAIPLYELVSGSFREGSASLQQVQDWAWPSRQIATFLLPDFFGNPTHHSYFDIWQRAWAPVTRNALGEPLSTIDWGVKNYVEGGNYLGIMTLLLACSAVAGRLLRRRPVAPAHPSSSAAVPLFAVLAVLSLLFAFGTPLYALLYYGLPGYSQLHSAFRWVFPFTLSMAALAGFGLDALLGRDARPGAEARRAAGGLPLAGILGGLAAAAGAGALLVVLISVALPGPFVALGERLLAWSDLARQRGFADGAMAWSYEAAGLARFGLVALLAGVTVLWRARRPRASSPDLPGLAGEAEGHPPSSPETDLSPIVRPSLRQGLAARGWPLAVLAVLILDLWLVGHSFNPAVDPKLLEFAPPVVRWLQEHQDPAQPWRLTSFDAPGEKLLNANAAMPYGLEDVRGYDSIILRQYAAYMERIQPQGDLLYNRIAPVYTQVDGRPNYDALDSRLLDLLGVRYVVTTHAIPNAGFSLVYDGEVRVYENRDAFPRVFIAPAALAAADQAQALDLLQGVDPAQTVVVEGIAAAAVPPPASPELRDARISRRSNREIFIDVNLSDRGWLVLADSFFEGWKAYLRPYGVAGEGVNASGESIEQQLPIYRADGLFRAVYIPQAGQWTVRFVYSPRSLLLGLYTSFLAAVTVLLMGGWWAWGRYYRGEGSEVGTVAKNSAVQMIMSLTSKGIDFAFAMLRMRVLSPAGEGSYVFAISFYGVFEIVTRFGLGTLLTRDVALDRSRAGRYLANVVALRAGLWLLSLPLMVIVGLVYRVFLNQLTVAEIQAIAIFAAALLFANIADAISAVFNAYEKMEYPAGTATAVAVAKVALGALVLLPPFDLGFVGLAWVSLVMNVVQVAWLYVLLHRKVLVAGAAGAEAPMSRETLRRVRRETRAWAAGQGIDLGLQRHMLVEAGPLMINHLLATVFWRISQFVLRGATNPAALGIFSAGVKYLDGLNVIPSYFTLAIFPLMSRYAAAGKESLVRAYRVALQLLFMVSLPIAVIFSFAATPLIRILGGSAYLPDSATALAIMIWSIPIGFVNSVTQYVLIAVNQQRTLTRAFVIGVAFTAAANLVLVPRFGYLAAAWILIPAELSLFIPFAVVVARHVAPMPWHRLLARPLLAAGLDVAAVWGLGQLGLPLLAGLIVGFGVYVAALVALGAFRGDDFAPLMDRARQRLGRRVAAGE